MRGDGSGAGRVTEGITGLDFDGPFRRGRSYHEPKAVAEGFMAKRVAVSALLLAAISGFAFGQQAGQKPGPQSGPQAGEKSGQQVARKSAGPVKNSDVIDMTKAGLRTHTILLRIKQGPDSFDTSPQALIQLQKAGVNPTVIDAVLLAKRSAPKPHPKPPVVHVDMSGAVVLTGGALLEKALDAFGPREELAKVNSIRWAANVVETTADGHTASYTEQREESYPGRLYMTVLGSSGASEKLVITPDFSYETADNLTRAIGSESAAPYREQMRFDPAYIAQHLQDYATEVIAGEANGDDPADVLKISLGEADYLWRIDAATGRLISSQLQLKSGDVVTREYSDYRPVGDLSFPFAWRTTERGRTIETTVREYDVNPEGSEVLFERPANLSGTELNFRVVDTQAVSHGQEVGGGGFTGCQLSQAANASVVNALDDVDFAKGLMPSNLQMTCNSWDTAKFFPHKLNAMLVEASDGKAYILTCDEGTRWSKCYPLHAGQVFHATRTETGISVEGMDGKGREEEVNYTIAQAETLP